MKVAILSNEIVSDIENWIIACKNFSINYEIIYFIRNNWLDQILSNNFDYFLAKPSGNDTLFKNLYDERIFILNELFPGKIYPTPLEIFLYENKRFLYSWLKSQNLPHPKTFIFYDKNEAKEFIENTSFPIVAKTNIGASGSGVKIIKNKHEAYKYLNNAFNGPGIKRRWGPKSLNLNLFKKFLINLKNPDLIISKINVYLKKFKDKQKEFVIFQEFIEHDYEWRVVVIGDSFFAHKKLKIGDKASGSLLKNYENPPLYLFDFAKNIMNKFGFVSQAIDIFEQEKEKLLINEMQCIFGQSDPYQMLVDGKPGRYRFVNNKWVFEEGNFTTNACYDLRIKHILSLINKNCF